MWEGTVAGGDPCPTGVPAVWMNVDVSGLAYSHPLHLLGDLQPLEKEDLQLNGGGLGDVSYSAS